MSEWPRLLQLSRARVELTKRLECGARREWEKRREDVEHAERDYALLHERMNAKEKEQSIQY